MSLHYLIDGYNLLYALPEIPRGIWEEKRKALLQLLKHTRPYGHNRCTIIFDSREGGGSQEQAGDITIVFTAGQTADDWIIRKVRELAQPRTLVVVSDDRGIQTMIRGTGARSMPTAEFLRLGQSAPKSTPSQTPPDADDITEEFKKRWT